MKTVIRVLIIIVIFILLFVLLNMLLQPKYAETLVEGSMISQYYTEPKDHEVIFIGDCEVYANFSPMVMYEEQGIKAYVRGSSQQLIWQSYQILKETLKYEKPKVVVFNVNSMRYDKNSPEVSEAYNRLTIDKMKWSQEKIDIIKDSMTEDETFLSYVFPILRYHSRYDKLTSEDFEYLFKKATTIPTKTSVTEIKRMQEYSAKENSSKDIHNNEKLEIKNENIEIPKPKFLQTDEETKITNAEKGTLIHLCMQKLDIAKKEYILEDVKKLVDELQIKKIISQKEAEAININKVYQFTKTALWNEIVQAKEVQREKPFYISIPANEIYKVSDELQENLTEEVIVQGIIDLYYINNNNELILVDFKTDYVPNNEGRFLVDKYKSQLELYKKALESAMGRKVDKVYIYSTFLNKEIELSSKNI